MAYKFEKDGKSFEIPLLKDVPVGILRKTRKVAKNEEDRSFLILEELLGEGSEALAALDSFTAEEFGSVMRGWTQGASLGE